MQKLKNQGLRTFDKKEQEVLKQVIVTLRGRAKAKQ